MSRWGVKVMRRPTIEDLKKLPPLNLSEELKQVIRDSKVPALQGLLGPDADAVMLKLAMEYWELSE